MVKHLAPVRDIVAEELERLFGAVSVPTHRPRRLRAVRTIREAVFRMSPRDDAEVRQIIGDRYQRLCQNWPGQRPTDQLLASLWEECRPPVVNGPASRDVALQYLREFKDRHQ